VSVQRHGGLAFPAPEQEGGEAAGDPGLTVLLSCLQAAINARLGAVWARIRTGTETVPCRTTYPYDPSEGVFNLSHMPSLHGWRVSGETEQIAADYRITRDNLCLLWVYPIARQGNAGLRHAFAGAVEKVINAVLKLGRDPAWVVPGDPDPNAATLGSLLWTHAGFWKADGRLQWSRVAVAGTTGDDATPGAHALQVTFAVEERLVVVGDDPLSVRVDLAVGGATPPFVTDSLLLLPPS
jgi:hypothetical protein